MLNGKELLDKSTNIIYEKIPENGFPVTIVYAKEDKHNPILISPKHYHRSLEFVIPFNATAQIWVDGKERIINPYHIGLINSNSIHETRPYEFMKSDCYEGIAVQIRYEFLKKLYPEYDNIYFSTDIDETINEELLKLFLALFVEYNRNSETQNIAINGYLQLIMTILLRHQKRDKGICIHNRSDKNLKELMGVITYIDDNYSKFLDANMISEHFGFSYGYLSRIFKKQFTMTIKEYITSVRLDHCTYDLIHTDNTSTDIALDNGFPNVKSFNREFRMKYNMSPKNYRKEVQK